MPGVIPRNPYGGQRATLVTLHHKDRVLAPLLEAALGVALETLRDVDTDALGTFTRDVPRHGTQLETARRKAQLAIERRGGTLARGQSPLQELVDREADQRERGRPDDGVREQRQDQQQLVDQEGERAEEEPAHDAPLLRTGRCTRRRRGASGCRRWRLT